jgi:hypothetical protein
MATALAMRLGGVISNGLTGRNERPSDAGGLMRSRLKTLENVARNGCGWGVRIVLPA